MGSGKQTGLPGGGGPAVREGLRGWLSRPWWTGLGVILATVLALMGYFLVSGGGSPSYSHHSTQSGNGAAGSATPTGTVGGSGQNIPTASPTPSAGAAGQPGSPIGKPYQVTVSESWALTFSPVPAKPAYSVCTADFGLGTPCSNYEDNLYSNDKQIAKLPAGTTPTYQRCVNDTRYVSYTLDMGAPSIGEVFCLLATDGIEVGIVVRNSVASGSSIYMTLESYEWQSGQPA